MEKRIRRNREIRTPKIQLIDASGEMVGIVSLEEGLRKAQEDELDLVEVDPNASPPICKILDWGKYSYKKTKALVTKRQQETKVIRLGYRIGEHDLDVKVKKAQKFIERGDKVKVSLIFKGREIVHKALGEEILRKFSSKMAEIAETEKDVTYTGREASLILTPKRQNA
ncbi:MAG: translation initiation factor IF-3 [Patescibacteria group bacterium]|nr:translation initiation factor IF-3 [Patescibacteria group bacterium]